MSGYRVVFSPDLSEEYDRRFVIVDDETGQVLDDAQGYGYKSPQNAHAAWAYKHRDRSKDSIKKKTKRNVLSWCKEHQDFVEGLESIAFHVAKGSYGPEAKFNSKYVKKAFDDAGFSELPFSISEFLRYWQS